MAGCSFFDHKVFFQPPKLINCLTVHSMSYRSVGFLKPYRRNQIEKCHCIATTSTCTEYFCISKCIVYCFNFACTDFFKHFLVAGTQTPNRRSFRTIILVMQEQKSCQITFVMFTTTPKYQAWRLVMLVCGAIPI